MVLTSYQTAHHVPDGCNHHLMKERSLKQKELILFLVDIHTVISVRLLIQ
jgi:hypothetical protein